MTKFASKVSAAMARNKVTYSALSAATGISSGQLHRLANGTQTWVSPETMVLLSKALGTTLAEQADFLRAYLLDNKKGPAADLVEIRVHSQVDRTHDARPTVPPNMQQILDILITEAEYDSDLSDLLRSLARLVAPEKLLSSAKGPVKY